MKALGDVSRKPGVEEVRTDARTGSALITYDPEVLDMPSAIGLIRKAHEAFVDVAPPRLQTALDSSVSRAGGTIRERFSAADGRVRKATHGTVDLRALMPIGLAGLSLRQLVRQGPGVSSVPWYVFAYYSFDSFIKLHSGTSRGARDEESS